jgi:hypothetical protein
LEQADELTACRRATILADEVAGADPANLPARNYAIGAHNSLGMRLQQMHLEGGVVEIRRAVEMADQLAAERPDLPGIRALDAVQHEQYGQFLLRAGDPHGALNQLQNAARMRDPLLLDPNDMRAVHEQARTLSEIGEIAIHERDCRQALGAFEAAIKLMRDPREIEHARQMMRSCEAGSEPGPRY